MENTPANTDALRLLKHDIKNQLSNIHLAIETIKFEVNQPTEDFKFCVDAITASTAKIDELLKDLA